MKTEDLIKKLVQDKIPLSRAISPMSHSLTLVSWGFGLVILSALLLPTRDDLSMQLSNVHYYLESFFWVVLSLTGAYASFNLLVPGTPQLRPSLLWSFSLIGLLILISLRLTDLSHLTSQMVTELDFRRGWCGPLIVLTGSLLLIPVWKHLKNGLVTNRVTFSLIMASCLSCFGSISMQYVCAHESAVHILMWHFPPIGILGFFLYKVIKSKNL